MTKKFIFPIAAMVFAGLQMACAGEAATYQLRETVTLREATWSLADLLPDEVPPAILHAAQAIPLGRAPNPGSVRILRAVDIRLRLAKYSSLQGRISIPERVVVTRIGHAISSENLRRAIQQFLLSQAWPQAQLPVQLTSYAQADSPDADLQVIEVSWDARQSALNFEVRCRQKSGCGSFLVQAPASVEQAIAWPEQLQRTRFTATNPVTGVARPVNLRAPLLAKAGSAAMLTIQSYGIRLRLPVICLQHGVLGQVIRARDTQSRKVYRAEVISPGVLRGLVD